MRLFVCIALLVPLTGCGKKKTLPPQDPAPPAPPALARTEPPRTDPHQAPPGSAPRGESSKPNWLDDPRFKRTTGRTPPDAPPTKSGWIRPDPDTDWAIGRVPPPQPPAAPGVPPTAEPPAATAPRVPTMIDPTAAVAPRVPVVVDSPPGAAPRIPTPTGSRPVTRDDMNEVWIFIENSSLATGQMPPPELTYAALVQANAKAAELVRDGSIILTGTRHRDSIWAFERSAPTRGGWVASHNGPEHLTAAEFARRLGR